MKKKILVVITALICAFSFAACGGGGGNGGGGDGHHYASAWTSGSTHHWHQCADEDCNEPKKDYAEHSDSNNDGKCDVCNILIPSKGLEFGEYDDIYDEAHLGYLSITGLGTCTDKNIILPSADEDGKPVLAIGPTAFEETDIESVAIPNGIAVIGAAAFAGCESLAEVTFEGKSLRMIGGSAFQGCPALKSIEIPEGVTHIGEYAFIESAVESISVPSSLTSVGDEAFHYFANKSAYN